MKLDEVGTLASELLRADEVASARGESATAPGHIEPIELREPELATEESVGGLLQTAVGAGDDERMWSFFGPAMADVGVTVQAFGDRGGR